MIRWRDSSSLPLPQANAIDQHQGIKRYEVKKKGELYQLPPLVPSALQHVSQTELLTVVIASVHARSRTVCASHFGLHLGRASSPRQTGSVSLGRTRTRV